jgi:tRNA(fMet)-specific endonuclease VapC
MRFLVDTNICSAHLKNMRSVNSRFIQHAGALAMSVITLGELSSWVLRRNASPKHLKGLTSLISDVETLDVDYDVAWKYGELNSELLDRGLPPPGMDLLIAATALVHNLILVTHLEGIVQEWIDLWQKVGGLEKVFEE